jgi:hypothetical protein
VKSLAQKTNDQPDSNSVLKKREDFAISLRKKKHNEMISTKRKANMHRAFERTIQQIAPTNDQGTMKNSIQIRDSHTLNTILGHIDYPALNNDERLMLLKSIREMTITVNDNIPYKEIVENRTLVSKTLSLLKNHDVSIACKSESLWILTNIACEPKKVAMLINEFEVFSIIQAVF